MSAAKWSLEELLDGLHKEIEQSLRSARLLDHPTAKGDASEAIWRAEQRADVLREPLLALGLKLSQITAVVEATGERPADKLPGFTYSDLRQRLIPAIVLDAYPQAPVHPDRAIELAKQMVPTPLFKEER